MKYTIYGKRTNSFSCEVEATSVENARKAVVGLLDNGVQDSKTGIVSEYTDEQDSITTIEDMDTGVREPITDKDVIRNADGDEVEQ